MKLKSGNNEGEQKNFPWLLPLFLIAFAMTWAALGGGFWEREFWYDEAFTGLIIQLPWSEMFESLKLDVHPPLYYLILKGWAEMFGYSDIALRSFSVLCFGGFLSSLFLFVREGTHRLFFAISTLIFFSFNPFFVQYAQEARMYALLAFLIITAALFFLRAVTRSPAMFNADWLLFSAFLALSPLVHYTALLVAPAFFIAGGLFLKRHSLTRSYLTVFSQAMILPILTFLPWYPHFRGQLANTVEAGWIGSLRVEEIPLYLSSFFFGTEQNAYGHPPPRLLFGIISPAAVGLIIGFASFFLAQVKGSDERLRYFFRVCAELFGLILLVFLLLELDNKHLVLSRYLIIAVPFLLIAFLLLIERLPKPLPVFLLLFYIGLTFTLSPAFAKTDYRALNEILSGYADRQIVFTDPFDYFIASFYNRSGRDYVFYQGDKEEDVSGWVLFRQLPLLPKNANLPTESIVVVRQENPSEFFNPLREAEVGKFQILSLSEEDQET